MRLSFIQYFNLNRFVIGISAFYHDSAAAIIKNGEIIAAAQEERFSRIKHDASFPINGLKYILDEASISLENVDSIVFYEKPFLKFERLLETYVSNTPKGFNSFRKAMPIWMREKLFQKRLIIENLKKLYSKFDENKLFFSDHHLSHAASAFYPSPYEEAIVLTLDGVGEWATTTVSIGKKNSLEIIKEIHFPDSLGLLYSAFTYYAGFKVNSGEYKLMGLAPYGTAKYADIIFNKLIEVKEDGSFKLNQSYFNYSTGLTMVSKKFIKLFKQKVRNPNIDKISQFHMDIAASIQYVIETIILKITRSIHKEFKIKNLCLAGGVALNCVANGKILNDDTFENIWIQPASGDSGGSIGAALAFWYKELKMPRLISKEDSMKGSYLGPKFNNEIIKKDLTRIGANFRTFEQSKLIHSIAKALAKGKAVGWFQDRMEFGPRALGCRSILADPRSENMQKILNLKIKFRESFRPFAPSILNQDLSKWFDLKSESPYMLLVAEVKKIHRTNLSDDDKRKFGIEKLNIKRSVIPAVTHVDYSARIQTVKKETNLKFYLLINEFKKITGCPILINTSFNVRGEPIVCSPEDAFKCFMGTNLDMLAIGNLILNKSEQNKNLLTDYKNKYELD